MHRNLDTTATRTFHEETKWYADAQGRGGVYGMMGVPPNAVNIIWKDDWSDDPLPYKIYETLAPIAIPRAFTPTAMPALDAIAAQGDELEGERVPDLAALARIALLSNGILKRSTPRAGESVIEYRAAGGTGARYHLELYFICGDLPDLEAGIYHYAAHDHSFRQVRAGDFRAVVVEATGREATVAAAPVILAMTSTFWRNAWQYMARAYRHAYWDAGTTFANILPLAASAELPARLVFGFADKQVNALLGVDGRREATLALCTIGRTDPVEGTAPDVEPLDLPTRPISDYEVEFPLIGMMHEASSLASDQDVAAWRAHPLCRDVAPPTGDALALRPAQNDEVPGITVEDLIQQRRSTRNYDTRQPIGFDEFSTLLDRSTRGVATDCLAPDAPPLHDHYLIVNAVEGIEPGAYRFNSHAGSVELIRPGVFREEATQLAADQAYAGNAHVNSYYLARLDPILERYGNRGYRVAQLMAALSASKLHLGTHALELGAVGSTSYDDDVTRFFTSAADAAYLFVVVFGKQRPRAGARN